MRSLLIATIVLTCIASVAPASPIADLAKTDGDRLPASESNATVTASKWLFFFSKSLVGTPDNIDRPALTAYVNTINDSMDYDNRIASTDIVQDDDALEAIESNPADVNEPTEKAADNRSDADRPTVDPQTDTPAESDQSTATGIPDQPLAIDPTDDDQEEAVELKPLEIDETIDQIRIDESGEADLNEWLESFDQPETDESTAPTQTESVEQSPEATTTFDVPDTFSAPQIDQIMEVMAEEEDIEELELEAEEIETEEVIEEAAEETVEEEIEATEAELEEEMTEETAEEEVLETDTETTETPEIVEDIEEEAEESEEEEQEEEIEEFIKEIEPDGDIFERDEIEELSPPENIIAEETSVVEDNEAEDTDEDGEEEVDNNDDEAENDNTTGVAPIRHRLRGAAGQIRWRIQQLLN